MIKPPTELPDTSLEALSRELTLAAPLNIEFTRTARSRAVLEEATRAVARREPTRALRWVNRMRLAIASECWVEEA